MTTYTVTYQQNEAGYWLASVRGVPGCHTKGRSLQTARKRIREALSVCVDDAEQAELVDEYQPALVFRLVGHAKKAREAAEKAQAGAQVLLARAVGQLLDSKLSHRDAAIVLGISHRRVAQLAPWRAKRA